jgi:hypothetical protein
MLFGFGTEAIADRQVFISVYVFARQEVKNAFAPLADFALMRVMALGLIGEIRLCS